jgi:TPR repeat protein
MGAVRILLIALAASSLFGCVLLDWIPIRYEPLPRGARTESAVQDEISPVLAEPQKQNIRKSPALQTVKEKSPVKPRKGSRREAEPPSDREREINGYRRTAATEDPEAQYSLGSLYLSGEEGGTDYARALDLFLAAAEMGHSGALRTLGQMYENGIGIPPSPSEALKWYSLAAGHGDVRAMTAFGYVAFTGFGTPQNTEVGLTWLKLAGEEGDSEAQLLLGAIYDSGWAVEADDAEALKWYALAAERGDSLARFMQACQHALGESGPLDLVNAARYYRMAAASGFAEAQAVLDNRHINLSGDDSGLRWKQGLVEKRPRYAGERLERFSRMVETFKGAALGDVDAMFGVGSFYWRGDGFEKDFDQAVRWWRLAARLGHKKAKAFLARLGDFEKNGASGEASPMTRVGQKELPATLVYQIGVDLLEGGESSGEIHPSSAWMSMLRKSRQINGRPLSLFKE